jgi:hypothetical protein
MKERRQLIIPSKKADVLRNYWEDLHNLILMIDLVVKQGEAYIPAIAGVYP